MNDCTHNEEDIREIRDHIAVLNDEHGELVKTVSGIEVKLGKVEVSLDWLSKTYWVVATASVGSLVVGLFGLLNK